MKLIYISGAKLKQGIRGVCEEEGLRVVQLSAQKTRLPSIIKNGTPMKAKHDMPIRFKIE